MTIKSRQPAGVPTGGQFAAKPHDEADITLDEMPNSAPDGAEEVSGQDRTPPGHDRYRPYEPPSWDERPAHDMVTEMAPDMAAQIRGFRFAGPKPPDGMSPRDWNQGLAKLQAAFESVDSLKDEPFFDAVGQARFEDAMDFLRRHGHDGRLAAHTARTVTPALNRFADHLAARRAENFRIIEEEYGEVRPDLLEPDDWENEVRECATAFGQARIDLINGVSAPERKARTEAAAKWLADNYLGLWT